VLESYLSIAIRPSSIPDRFFVNGWLIPDSSITDNSQRFYPLDLDQSDRGIACGLDEIPKVLNNLLELGLQQLKGNQHELTIEIFLPMSCLCADVDRWTIDDLYAEIPVGTRYRTIVRSSDRLEGRYLNRRWSDWVKRNFSDLLTKILQEGQRDLLSDSPITQQVLQSIALT
jgi:vWA-MoxR associated protein C-terminal domain